MYNYKILLLQSVLKVKKKKTNVFLQYFFLSECSQKAFSEQNDILAYMPLQT